MEKLSRNDLWSLEEYSVQRAAFRREVLAHKRNRQVHLGPHATLYFEDRTTIRYQIQEMLRVERIFESTGITAELEAYNPLIPDGHNLKATFMLEYPDAEERRRALEVLRGIEHRVWLEVGGFDRIWAIADEDIERSDENKTSSVHFLRFELGRERSRALGSAATLGMGISHPSYSYAVAPVEDSVRRALAADLDG